LGSGNKECDITGGTFKRLCHEIMVAGYMKFNNHHVQAHLQCVKESHAYLERIISCVETVPLIKRLEEKEKKEREIYHDP